MPDPKYPPRKSWKLGSRGSSLALAQAREVLDRLKAARGSDPREAQIVQISTAGDRLRDRALADFGGKGLFVGEIHAALIRGEIDLATHSAKDLPGALEPGIELVAALPRADCADALITAAAAEIGTLPESAAIGTASPRRRAQLLRRRPDLEIGLLRGNIGTRLAAVRGGGRFHATLLAMAGLRRLGLDAPDVHRLDPEEWLPALGQGTVAVTARRGDGEARDFARGISEAASWDALLAERAFLARLGGDCHSPIAGLARATEDGIELRGEILRPDGSESHADRIQGGRGEATTIGRRLAEILLDRAGAGFWNG